MKFLNQRLWVFILLFSGFSLQTNAAPVQKCGVVVGGTSFVKAGATATERYCLDEILYDGSALQSFEMNGTTFRCSTAGNLTRTGGGDFTIVQNVGSVNGPDGFALQNTMTDGTFLITPTNNERFARYTIDGLVPGGTYTVKIGLRSARVMQTGVHCNDEPAKISVRINRKDGTTSSTNFNGRVSSVQRAGCGNQPTVGASWDTNNGGDFNFLRFDAIFEIEATINLSQGGFTDGFTIDFSAEQGANTVVGIDFIEITGCIDQEIVSSAGNEFCEGMFTVLTAKGIGTATELYEWGTGAVGSNIILGEIGNQITVRPIAQVTTVGFAKKS